MIADGFTDDFGGSEKFCVAVAAGKLPNVVDKLGAENERPGFVSGQTEKLFSDQQQRFIDGIKVR